AQVAHLRSSGTRGSTSAIRTARPARRRFAPRRLTALAPVALYLGLDSSTQSLSAVVIEIAGDNRRVVEARSFGFDERLPHYGTRHGVLPHRDSRVATSSPRMWAEALDVMLGQLAKDVDVRALAAISGSAQQHGSVYLNDRASSALATLDAAVPLVEQ